MEIAIKNMQVFNKSATAMQLSKHVLVPVTNISKQLFLDSVVYVGTCCFLCQCFAYNSK